MLLLNIVHELTYYKQQTELKQINPQGGKTQRKSHDFTDLLADTTGSQKKKKKREREKEKSSFLNTSVLQCLFE